MGKIECGVELALRTLYLHDEHRSDGVILVSGVEGS